MATRTCRGCRLLSLKLLLVAAVLLSAAPARPAPSNGLPTEFRPSLPVFGGGRVVNFLNGDNQAMTNAAAHVGFSLAVPLVGEHFWGRKGLWAAGLSWMALSLVQESLFHAPAKAGPGYPAEVRSDLITRLVPCATLLIVDAIRGGGHAAMSPSMPTPPGHPGSPWPIGREMSSEDEVRRATELAALSGSAGGGAPEPQMEVAKTPDAGLTRPAAKAADGPADVLLASACTESLLFQGSAACSWDAARPAARRPLAAR